MKKKYTYAQAGVDIEKEAQAVKALAGQLTYRREQTLGKPLLDIGHYAGLIEMGDLVLALTTDGVGSKLLVAREMGRWDTIGIDCVAMNVNDLLAIGVEPVAFVDYIATQQLDETVFREIGRGLNRAAEMSRITIVGGETATLPDIVRGLDLAGTCLGVGKKDRIITGRTIEAGDLLLGLPSSGPHSNGYTLIRKIIKDSGYTYQDPFPPNPSVTIGEELLTPTRIYMEILSLVQECQVHGLAHITGSGLLKLQRLTNKLGFEITSPLPVNPIFRFLQETGGMEDREMYRTFNMGMGFLAVIPPEEENKATEITGGSIIGEITKEKGIRVRDLKLV